MLALNFRGQCAVVHEELQLVFAHVMACLHV